MGSEGEISNGGGATGSKSALESAWLQPLKLAMSKGNANTSRKLRERSVYPFCFDNIFRFTWREQRLVGLSYFIELIDADLEDFP
jgi:hypothetical protein